MTPPRLIACYFGPPRDQQWSRLATVLSHTVSRHCPGWDVSIERIQPPPMTSAVGSTANVANTQKLDYWAAAVEACPDGARVLLIDVDTFLLRGLNDVWDLPFDVAYTTRDTSGFRYPLNAGVVFLRVSDPVRQLIALWRDENRRMLADAAYHRPWFKTYGGINQAALGKVLEEGAPTRLGVSTTALPCQEWNCEDSTWESFAPELTRIVHVKSALRLAVFHLSTPLPKVRPLERLWRELEKEAVAAEGRRSRA